MEKGQIDKKSVGGVPKLSSSARSKGGFFQVVFAGNVPFVIFLTLLAILYIVNVNKAAHLVGQIGKNRKEIKELRWEYLDLKTELIQKTSESNVIKRVGASGLQPLRQPAFEIKNKVIIKQSE